MGTAQRAWGMEQRVTAKTFTAKLAADSRGHTQTKADIDKYKDAESDHSPYFFLLIFCFLMSA